MTQDIDLLTTLKAYGLEGSLPLKAYRHVNHMIGSTFIDVESIYRSYEFDDFQARMGRGEYSTGLVAVFMGEPNNLARFLGVWSVGKVVPSGARDRIPSHRSFYHTLEAKTPWMELTHDERFSALENRLVVRWPKGRLPHRWVISRSGEKLSIEVEGIRSHGFRGSFPGFSDLVLSHADLASLDAHGDGGSGWIEALKSTRGVYLITDMESGSLYVGSATSTDGLWGRWSYYAKSVHGGNMLMIDAVAKIKGFSDHLQFSVLETMSNLATRDDGLTAERRWKVKLGKKAIILNGN